MSWGSGVMMVSARAATIGPSESIPAIKAAGYTHLDLNVATGEWADERRIAAANGLEVVPWMRTRTPTDLDTLDAARRRWGCHAVIPNLEIEDTRNSPLMAKALKIMSYAGRGLVITDGWADPIGKWLGFYRWTGSPECFPEELLAYKDVNGCVGHASSFFHSVVPALGCYGTRWLGRLPKRSDYDYPAGSPFIAYPGDQITDYRDWHP